MSGRSRERWFYVLVSPWLVGLVFLQAAPIVGSTVLAFTRWEPPLEPRWVGLDNLASLLSDPRFLHAVANTLVYAVGTVVPGLAIGLGLAVLLRSVPRGGNLLRAIVFAPAIVSGVATALVWGWIFNPRFGLADGLLGLIGIRGPAWLRDPTWAMPALIVIGLWNVGLNTVVYLAALNAVPRDLLEAAAIDGASPVARFRSVTWPALLPVTFYLAVANVVGAFQVFTPAWILTRGGPDDATLTTAVYTYEAAFEAGRLGYASAMAVVVLVVVLGLTLAQFRLIGPRLPYLGGQR